MAEAGAHRPSLRRAAARLFAAGLLFRDAPGGGRPDPQQLRAQLSRELDAFAKHPEAGAFSPEETDAARFAIVAWLDEVIIASGWAGAEDWISHSLQLELYKTNRAGNEFYDRLAVLPPAFTGAREVFFTCLAQGFRGQYADNEPERMRILQQQYSLLHNAGIAISGDQLPRLTPAAYDLNIDIQDPSGSGLSSILLGWALAGIGIYAALWVVVWLLGRSVGLSEAG